MFFKTFINNILSFNFKSFFPIKKSEFKLFFSTALLMLLILFNTSIFKTLKDTLIITDKNSGAEVVNFLKIFIVVPLSFIFVFIYSKACNVLDSKKIFYLVISFFTIFFLCFALFLYPNKALLHPSQDTISMLKLSYPRLKWIIPIYGLWTYSLFYSMADLWCSMCLSLLFWQFVNQIIAKEKSRRFYGSFAIIGYMGLIIAGHTIKGIFNYDAAFDSRLTLLLFITAACNMAIMLTYYFITTYLSEIKEVKFTVKKSKVSLLEGFKIIFRQKQVMHIMIVVFCYNFSINIVETTWKAELKAFATNKSQFIQYLGSINQTIGYTTILLGFISNILFQSYSWFLCAMITPILACITSALFFMNMSFQYFGVLEIFGISVLLLCVIAGSAHNVLSKSGKYVFFDQTKEMAYLPLDHDAKTKGKAAVDVAGSRLSKSLSGQVQAILLIIIPNSSQLKIFPYLSIILIFIFALWFWSLRQMSKDVDNSQHSKQAIQ